MNTPKQIAIELVDKMYFSRRYKEGEDYIPAEAWKHAKKCALIAVDEILKILDAELGDPVEHWQQVIQEINKL